MTSISKTVKKLKLGYTWPLHFMLFPCVVLLVIFSYIPMAGIVIAFQDFIPTKGFFGSPWTGTDNYKTLMLMPGIMGIIRNTLVISILKIVTLQVFSIVFALLLNEIFNKFFRRLVQSLIFFPFFLSWVVVGGIVLDVFSLKGIVNQVLGLFGINPVFFLGKPGWFIMLLLTTNIWKEFGYSIIIYIAAISNIDITLYEAAEIDGANRFQQTWHVTLSSIKSMIVLVAILALSGVLNAGFDQVYNLYNPLVVGASEIIDTYVYKLGFVSAQYSLATAVGLFKSIIGYLLIVASFKAAEKYSNYRII